MSREPLRFSSPSLTPFSNPTARYKPDTSLCLKVFSVLYVCATSTLCIRMRTCVLCFIWRCPNPSPPVSHGASGAARCCGFIKTLLWLKLSAARRLRHREKSRGSVLLSSNMVQVCRLSDLSLSSLQGCAGAALDPPKQRPKQATEEEATCLREVTVFVASTPP